jgi:signal peptidase I
LRSREQKNRHPIRSFGVLGPVTAGLGLVCLRLAAGRTRRVVVRGESMTPSLRPGDAIVVWDPIRRVRAGQVVVYRDRFDDRLRVKRVVSVGTDETLVVRGDNVALSSTPGDLGPVAAAQVVGVGVVRVVPGRSWSPLRYHRVR